jgi:hypothetical protein
MYFKIMSSFRFAQFMNNVRANIAGAESLIFSVRSDLPKIALKVRAMQEALSQEPLEFVEPAKLPVKKKKPAKVYYLFPQ